MAIWMPNTVPADAAFLGDFRPQEVVFEFEGPRTFTVEAADGSLLLAHQCDEDDDLGGFLVAAISPPAVRRLMAGDAGIRESLDRLPLWYAAVGFDNRVRAVHPVAFADIPADMLPSPDARIGRLPVIERAKPLSAPFPFNPPAPAGR